MLIIATHRDSSENNEAVPVAGSGLKNRLLELRHMMVVRQTGLPNGRDGNG
ncbi:hypothetical protein ACQR16_32980 [Bradyrhizobium oligotrophicum]|uniref:hypothetical protein n=1 Tax=Bradyrhizobium oligotrophicum TaxID=44255 RepID=UPI003EB9D300